VATGGSVDGGASTISGIITVSVLISAISSMCIYITGYINNYWSDGRSNSIVNDIPWSYKFAI